MARSAWPTRSMSVRALQLDHRNPRLGRELTGRAPSEIIQHLFDHDKALDVAHSIATRGYFPNEPLLAVKEKDRYVVVEGNRRLAALKALLEPGILQSGSTQRQVAALARRIPDLSDISSVPVTIAPSRRATDRLLAGRHIGTPVLAWQAENRASFILDKIEEGYSNEVLRESLGFSLSDIQAARQTRAIADMVRSLKLPEEVRAKVDSPRANVFTTIERVVDSSVGRQYLHLKPDPEHGVRGTTTKAEFVRGFTRFVTDVALGKASSRTLNTNDNIKAYFESWQRNERIAEKRGAFVPADVISGRSVASKPRDAVPTPAQSTASRQVNPYVLPRDLKILVGSDRLIDIRNELIKLKRKQFPNAGAVLMRVFFELAVLEYLERKGDLKRVVERIEKKTGRKLPYGVPTMKELQPELTKIAKARLPHKKAVSVEKALRHDPAAPFSVADLNSFVHQSSELPNDRDILQFWMRTEPLFRLMLEDDEELEA